MGRGDGMELKSCPFCGGEAFIDSEWTIGQICAYLVFFVICTQCGCRTGFFEKPSHAEAAWNRRSPGKELAVWHPKNKNA